MRKLVIIVLLLVCSCPVVLAGGLQVSFSGVRDPCNAKLRIPETLFESCSRVDGSNVLRDVSGHNLLVNRTVLNSWFAGGTCAATADLFRNPVDGTLDADYLDSTGDNQGRRYQYSASTSANPHTGSVWVRVDTPHNVTVLVYEQGVGIVDETVFAATHQWRRIHAGGAGTGVGAIGVWLYPGERGVSAGAAYFYGAQLVECNQSPCPRGDFINPPNQNVTKPAHHLAATGTPSSVFSSFQMADGNRVGAQSYDGAADFHSKAHHGSLSVWDGDHVFTLVGKLTNNVYAGLFGHGTFQWGGMYIVHSASDIYAIYNNVGNFVQVYSPVDALTEDKYHIIQVVRSNDVATFYVDGVPGAPLSVAGYGTPFSTGMYLGAGAGGSSVFPGDIIYTRIDAKAASSSKFAHDYEVLTGIVSNTTGNVSFTRASTAMQTFSDGSMAGVAANMPRVGDGLLVEGADIQLHGLTEEFDSWTVGGVCAVAADDYTAPDGTLTADKLDNSGGGNTDNRYVVTANLGSLTGRTFTLTTLIRADIPHICSVRLGEDGVGNTDKDVMVTTEWQRYDLSRACVGGGSGVLVHRVYPGQNGVAVGVAHFWRANLTETTFPVSSIDNPGAATSQVTREPDLISWDPHPPNSTEVIIPEEFNSGAPNDKLTVYLEAKCQWSGVADIGQDRRLFEISGNAGTASGTRNRLQIYGTSTGRVNAMLRDDSDVDHFVQTALVDPVDYSEWFSTRFVVDFSDLSRMDLWVDNVSNNTYSGNSGTATFDTTDTMIRVGQIYVDTVNAHCHFRNNRVWNEEVAP